MTSFSLRVHPPVLFSYSLNHVDLIVRAENNSQSVHWVEAEVNVPEKLSLAPENSLTKGRVRVGILEGKEFIERSVRIFANVYTNPQMYRCKVTLFFYDKNGTIEKRVEKSIDIRCEIKKKEVI